MPKCHTEYVDVLIAHYGLLLSVDDVARLFKYASGESVRKAHAAGRLPVALCRLPERRSLFATAFDVADALGRLENMPVNEEET